MVIMDSIRDRHSRGRVGVERAHGAVVAGVHGLEEVERLRAAHLAHDDPLGPHAQAVLDRGRASVTWPCPRGSAGAAVSKANYVRLLSCELAASSQVITRSSLLGCSS
jgi:hypothetical protein